MYEIKIRTNLRLVNRVKDLARERGISMNKMCIHLLEIGVYTLLEKEKENAKIKFKEVNS